MMAKTKPNMSEGLLSATDAGVDDLLGFDLMAVEGVVVRQQTQMIDALQMLAVPYEARNRYKVSRLPEGKRVATRQHDPERWQPTNKELYDLEAIAHAQEESDACLRSFLTCCGGLNLRPFTMHFYDGSATRERFRIVRPCRCGIKGTAILLALLASALLALVACVVALLLLGLEPRWLSLVLHGTLWPCFGLLALPCMAITNRNRECVQLELRAENVDGQVLGRVREYMDPVYDKCCDCCCRCTHYNAIYDMHGDGEEGPDGPGRHVFTTRVGLCCCGRHNNCCGGCCCRSFCFGCCKHDFIIDILDAQSGEVVATVQKTYAPSKRWCDSCCRMCQQFSNYLVRFPPHATQQQRVLLLAALIQVDYEHFEKGGDNG